MLNQRLISRLRNIDWDFSGSFSESAFSAIHWQPGRFVSQIPATLIGLLTQRGETVLDPFAGSGTTLIEAQRLGRPSIGLELSPVACAAIRAKTISASSDTLRKDVTALKERAAHAIEGCFGSEPLLFTPKTVQKDKWYTATTFRHLSALWEAIRKCEGRQQLLAQAAFSAILLPVCRETRHWGYVCDNTRPLTDHDGDVFGEYCKTLDRLILAYEQRDADRTARFGRVGVIEPAEVCCADSRMALSDITSDSIRLVVTSPPYFGVCDYAKAQRLSMEWFALEIEPFRTKEIGARSKRHRTSALNEYLEELHSIFSEIRRVLTRDGTFVMIIGQSQTRAAVLDDVRQIIKKVGYKMQLDLNRRVTSQRRQAPSVTGEHIFVLSPQSCR